MNYFRLVRHRIPPPSNHPDECWERQDDGAPVPDLDDIYWQAVQESEPLRVVRRSPLPRTDWKRFRYSETATPVTPEPSVTSCRKKPLTIQTDGLSDDDDGDALLEQMRSLYIRRHENEKKRTMSPYFMEETYYDPEEDPLECFMEEYEHVWWRRRPPKEQRCHRLSGGLF
jgi:hypothetical protein